MVGAFPNILCSPIYSLCGGEPRQGCKDHMWCFDIIGIYSPSVLPTYSPACLILLAFPFPRLFKCSFARVSYCWHLWRRDVLSHRSIYSSYECACATVNLIGFSEAVYCTIWLISLTWYWWRHTLRYIVVFCGMIELLLLLPEEILFLFLITLLDSNATHFHLGTVGQYIWSKVRSASAIMSCKTSTSFQPREVTLLSYACKQWEILNIWTLSSC